MEDTVEVIKTLLARTIEDEQAKNSWSGETDIINEIGLDSVQIVRFMLSLEDELGVSLDYEDMTFDVFGSINSLAKYITSQMGTDSI